MNKEPKDGTGPDEELIDHNNPETAVSSALPEAGKNL